MTDPSACDKARAIAMETFSDRLSNLVNTERMAAKGDPERIAAVLERLAHVTGWTLAITELPPEARAALAEGVAAQIFEVATGGESIIGKLEA